MATAFTNRTQRRSTVRDRDFFRAPLVSNHRFTLSALQSLTRRLDVAVDFLALSDHPVVLSSRAFLIAGPRKLDVAVNHTQPVADRLRLRWSAKVYNARNDWYTENGCRAPGVWATGGVTVMV